MSDKPYIATTLDRGRFIGSVITWIPANAVESKNLPRYVERHREVVRAILRPFRDWQSGDDRSAPLVTRRADGRTVVTFPGESVEFHRLRSLLPAGDLLITRKGTDRARIVTADGTNHPVRLSETAELAATAMDLTNVNRRIAVIEEHFTPAPSWAALELLKLYKRQDVLRTHLKLLGAFSSSGDLVQLEKERARKAANKRAQREREKYGITVTPSEPKFGPVTRTFSWLLCYCPHRTVAK